jgi:hypothetical protein
VARAGDEGDLALHSPSHGIVPFYLMTQPASMGSVTPVM